MGTRNGPYEADFPPGTRVRVAAADVLAEFMSTWRHHHPLTPEQLRFAGARGVVATVEFFHGADELYRLEGVPGVWHEACLVRDAE